MTNPFGLFAGSIVSTAPGLAPTNSGRPMNSISPGPELLCAAEPQVGEPAVQIHLLGLATRHRPEHDQRPAVMPLEHPAAGLHIVTATDLHRATVNGLHEVDHQYLSGGGG
jgi:hypothetical protein